MDLNLNEIEVRVVGALIEKEITTPEYYPLSMNALVAACNQKSNRDPVMNLDERDIMQAIDILRDKKLVWQLSTSGGRVPKYEHNIRSLFTFSNQEIAVLCVLMLRGAQTIGEIKGRSDRLYSFRSLQEVEETVQALLSREDGPFVMELPRQSGQKEKRFMHLFSGTPDISELQSTRPEPTAEQHRSSTGERLAALEEHVKLLREEVAELRASFEAFKSQLE